ncbi:hypothetical protein F8M41_026360 [Gigaspora margarita]|uniref:Uncharacterized protein n=1 Tax=Gigaspora margarita TaxID=4874 RepID=A0A8H3XH43_GIGMA|nr:hypothetical protein F8M41_026360 [Gigaspora margarita]
MGSFGTDGGEVPPEEKICSEQDSKCKKGKGVNKLKQELFAPELSTQDSSIEQNQLKGAEHVTEISETLCPGKLTSDNKSSIDEASHHLAQLCDKAFDAEDKANRANQEEILCWCLYAKDFIIWLNGIIENSRVRDSNSPDDSQIEEGRVWYDGGDYYDDDDMYDEGCNYEDKGYYYRDGRYERNVSPMTSLIISPAYV